jgi:DNA repair protein RecN (Recombination protein N)
MLCSIHIRDLAVVSSLELDFESGLTCLTGETGAGKSILLTAMRLALGERADSGFIRAGCDKATISLEFDLTRTSHVVDWLTEHELADDFQCIVRRVLSRDGRSRAFINGTPVTLHILQQLGEKLIDLHSQHAHLSLLQRDEQCRILDDASNNQALVERCSSLAREWTALNEQLQRKRERLANIDQRRELTQFQVDELEHNDIENLDYTRLVDEHKLQANIEHIVSTGHSQLELLRDHDHQSANSLLDAAIRSLSEFNTIAVQLNPVVDMLNEARIQVEEACQELRRYLDSLEVNSGQLETLDRRLSSLHALARKHQVIPQGLHQVLEQLRNEIEQINQGTEILAALEKQLKKVQGEYTGLANTLSANRRDSAAALQQKISATIKKLGMPEGNFEIRITPAAQPEIPRPGGYDIVEFMVTTNPGMPPRALGKVVSGGELSRISLAVQVTAIDSSKVPTMIFDEVDSGIGGGVAEIVGKRLRSLGNGRQVLCITHLPQVAAQSHQHMLVEKLSTKDGTRSTVRPLQPEQRRNEIARMLGGIEITEQTLAHASEMLDWNDR